MTRRGEQSPVLRQINHLAASAAVTVGLKRRQFAENRLREIDDAHVRARRRRQSRRLFLRRLTPRRHRARPIEDDRLTRPGANLERRTRRTGIGRRQLARFHHLIAPAAQNDLHPARRPAVLGDACAHARKRRTERRQRCGGRPRRHIAAVRRNHIHAVRPRRRTPGGDRRERRRGMRIGKPRLLCGLARQIRRQIRRGGDFAADVFRFLGFSALRERIGIGESDLGAMRGCTQAGFAVQFRIPFRRRVKTPVRKIGIGRPPPEGSRPFALGDGKRITRRDFIGRQRARQKLGARAVEREKRNAATRAAEGQLGGTCGRKAVRTVGGGVPDAVAVEVDARSVERDGERRPHVRRERTDESHAAALAVLMAERKRRAIAAFRLREHKSPAVVVAVAPGADHPLALSAVKRFRRKRHFQREPIGDLHGLKCPCGRNFPLSPVKVPGPGPRGSTQTERENRNQ